MPTKRGPEILRALAKADPRRRALLLGLATGVALSTLALLASGSLVGETVASIDSAEIVTSSTTNSSPQARLEALAQPVGKTILALDGAIANTNDGAIARLDRAMIESLGLHTLRTVNPFVEGEQVFEGVLLADLLALVGAQGATIVARALDGYTIDIPVSDATDYPVIVALKWNGEYMRVRSKGPLWVIYPVSDYTELNSEKYSSRSIWQLNHMTVK